MHSQEHEQLCRESCCVIVWMLLLSVGRRRLIEVVIAVRRSLLRARMYWYHVVFHRDFGLTKPYSGLGDHRWCIL